MTDDKMALVELLEKADDGDFLRTVAEAVLQILMEADVEGLIGAGRRGLRQVILSQDTQWPSRPHPGHAAGAAAAADTEAPPGLLLPALPRAQKDQREGSGRGHPGGLDRRRLDPAGR